MKKELENMFIDMSKEDLLSFFSDCGVEVEEVNCGEGGFYLEGEKLDCNFCIRKPDEIETYVTNTNVNVGFNSEIYKCINAIKSITNTRKFDIKDYVDFKDSEIKKTKSSNSYKEEVSDCYEEELTKAA